MSLDVQSHSLVDFKVKPMYEILVTDLGASRGLALSAFCSRGFRHIHYTGRP